MKVDYTERGAISVFLIIIFLALLMLAGLIVDICRVMAAERKVQNALDSAVRSILANYDQELVGQFGLFGVAAMDKAEELHRYFRVNLEERHQNFNFINIEINNVEINSLAQQSLLNDDIFKEQITEYMKYKGPLLLTNNVIDIFLKGSFGKKADLLNKGKEVAQDYKSIQRAQKRLNKEVKRVTGFAIGSTVERIVTIDNIKSSVQQLRATAERTIAEVKAANAKMAEVQEETKQLLLDEESPELPDFQGFQSTDDLEKLQDELKQMLLDLEYNQGIYEQIVALEEEANNLAVADFEGRYNISNQKSRLKERLRRIDNVSLIEEPEQESVSKGEADKKEALLTKLEKLAGPQISPDNPLTLMIEPGLFSQANQKNPKGDAESSGTLEIGDKIKKMSSDNDYAEEMSSNVFDYLRELNQGMQKIAVSGRDNMYCTEYIMDKYSFVTSAVSRGHYFDKGEVEYILCGNVFEVTNITEAFFRVWGMRFAFNAVDAFLLNPLPSFMARLAKALVQGFIWATVDMIEMYEGISVPVCKSLGKTSVEMSYSDHLRILLLLQNEKTQLERMRQLMQINIRQVNPDFELKNYVTIITGKADATLDLWFAPLLQLDKLGFERIQGNKFHLLQTSTQGY